MGIKAFPLARFDEFNTNIRQSIRHFSRTAFECRSNRSFRPLPIHRAKRLSSALIHRHHRSRIRLHRPPNQNLQPLALQIRQIASNNQIPFSARSLQRRNDSPQRSGSGIFVTDNAQCETLKPYAITNHGTAVSQRLQQPRHSHNQRFPIQFQQRLVPPHPRALPPSQNKPPDPSTRCHSSAPSTSSTSFTSSTVSPSLAPLLCHPDRSRESLLLHREAMARGAVEGSLLIF